MISFGRFVKSMSSSAKHRAVQGPARIFYPVAFEVENQIFLGMLCWHMDFVGELGNQTSPIIPQPVLHSAITF